MKVLWKGKTEKDEKEPFLCLFFFVPLNVLPAGPCRKLRNSFSVRLWFLLEAFYTFPLSFTLHAVSFREINVTAQMEKLDSSCKESCVLWALYLVSSL